MAVTFQSYEYPLVKQLSITNQPHLSLYCSHIEVVPHAKPGFFILPTYQVYRDVDTWLCAILCVRQTTVDVIDSAVSFLWWVDRIE
jgi:hypothetical protein